MVRAADVLDDLKRAATTVAENGTMWGIPGAKRLSHQVTGDTPDRLEVTALGFSDDVMYDAHVHNEEALREMALDAANARRLKADRFNSMYRDLERTYGRKDRGAAASHR